MENMQSTSKEITKMHSSQCYRTFKDIGRMECLMCEKKFSNNLHNMKRHCMIVHRVDIGNIKRGKIKDKIKPAENIEVEATSEDHSEEIQKVETEEYLFNQKEEAVVFPKLFERKRSNGFIKHRDICKTECLRCGRMLSGISASNIKRHFRLVHKISLGNDKLKFLAKKSVAAAAHDVGETTTQKKPKLSKCTTIIADPEEIEKNKFFKYCVGIVAVEGVSTSLFDDKEFFKKLIAPQEERFGTDLNSTDIITLLDCSSSKIRDIITMKMKNKIVSLKLDIAAGMYNHVLGINIQYIDDFKIHYNTLDIMQLDNSNIASEIKSKVVNSLERYQFNLDQIYCCTIHTVNNVETKNVVVQELNEDQICEELADFKTNISAANLIHLTVYEVLDELRVSISECRKVIENLLTASLYFRDYLTLDNGTNWLSIYQMLKSILESRNCVEEELAGSIENPIDWNFLTDITAALAPLVHLNNQLHNEQYIVGDFYRDWLSCEIELEELLSTSSYARLFVQTMQKYKNRLLNSDAFVTALYLDPRFNFGNSLMLDEGQRNGAEAFLTKSYKAMKRLFANQAKPMDKSVNEISVSEIKTESPTTSKKAYDKLAQRIMNLSANIIDADEPQRIFMQKLIGLLSNKTMAPLDTDVLQYWKNMNIDTEFSAVVEAALAVPVTQVAVGRATSALVNSTEDAINYNLLLTKYNFQEIKDPSVELDLSSLSC